MKPIFLSHLSIGLFFLHTVAYSAEPQQPSDHLSSIIQKKDKQQFNKLFYGRDFCQNLERKSCTQKQSQVLHEMVKEGWIEGGQIVLEATKGRASNIKDEADKIPLMIALEKQDLSLAHSLLFLPQRSNDFQRVNIKAKDKMKKSLLSYVMTYGDRDFLVSFAEYVQKQVVLYKYNKELAYRAEKFVEMSTEDTLKADLQKILTEMRIAYFTKDLYEQSQSLKGVKQIVIAPYPLKKGVELLNVIFTRILDDKYSPDVSIIQKRLQDAVSHNEEIFMDLRREFHQKQAELQKNGQNITEAESQLQPLNEERIQLIKTFLAAFSQKYPDLSTDENYKKLMLSTSATVLTPSDDLYVFLK